MSFRFRRAIQVILLSSKVRSYRAFVFAVILSLYWLVIELSSYRERIRNLEEQELLSSAYSFMQPDHIGATVELIYVIVHFVDTSSLFDSAYRSQRYTPSVRNAHPAKHLHPYSIAHG